MAIATTLPSAVAGAEEAPAQSDTGSTDVSLPQSYLDAYGWWNKTQQLPTGGGGVPAPACSAAETPASSSECAVGPPADGVYVVYDYQAAVPTTVTGPVGNVPTVPPPSAPPGAPVANPSQPQPLGQTAYGAVRFVVPEGAETELSLHFISKQSSNPGGQDVSSGMVFGCAITTPGWAAQQNGRYDQAPQYDCSSADQADVVGDTLVFDFPAGMVQNGLLDIAVVGAGDKPFQMAIDKPTDSSLTITNATELASPVDDIAVPDDVTYDDPLASFDAGAGDLGVDPSFGGNVAYTSDGSLSPSVAAPVVRPHVEHALPATRVASPFGQDASRGERLMAVAVLLLMGLALWWLGGRPVRAPQLLGSLGSSTSGDDSDASAVPARGIGRFLKPRTGRPPRLY